jgi:hypothetical protein
VILETRETQGKLEIQGLELQETLVPRVTREQLEALVPKVTQELELQEIQGQEHKVIQETKVTRVQVLKGILAQQVTQGQLEIQAPRVTQEQGQQGILEVLEQGEIQEPRVTQEQVPKGIQETKETRGQELKGTRELVPKAILALQAILVQIRPCKEILGQLAIRALAQRVTLE